MIIAASMEFRRAGNSSSSGNRGYNKKRNQQRTSQLIYQPPAQRGHNSMPVNAPNNSRSNSFL